LAAIRRVGRALPRKRRKRVVQRSPAISEEEVLEKEFYILTELGVPA